MKIFLLSKDNIMVNAFKNSLEDFYFLNDWEDVGFRVPDFGPDLIVLNEDLLNEEEEEELKKANSQIPVVYLLKEGVDLERAEGHILRKPLSFERLSSTLNDLLTQLKAQ